MCLVGVIAGRGAFSLADTEVVAQQARYQWSHVLGDDDAGIKGIGQDIGRELDKWSTILRWSPCGA